MDAIDALMTRRSIRKYTDKPLPEGAITRAIEAAMAAPSAGNQQAWHFIVVEDKGTLRRIAEINPNAKMAADAQAGVLFIGDPSSERFGVFLQQDLGACIENFLLAIHAQGLGAVWTGIYPREQRTEDFREFFGVPEELIPIAFVPVGWPGEDKGPSERFDEGRIHKGHWSKK